MNTPEGQPAGFAAHIGIASRLGLVLLVAVVMEFLGNLALARWQVSFALDLMLHMTLLVLVFSATWPLIIGIVRPLRDLASAADETARNPQRIITPDGPPEVRRVAVAFAAMQTRFLALVEDNMQTLVTASHDLRTPLHRMGLRAELLDDQQARHAILRDLKEMQSFVDTALDYIRTGDDETPCLLDLSTLLNTLATDARDQGLNVDCMALNPLELTGRKVTIIRMVQNLLRNSQSHARHIRITLSGTQGKVATIRIEDDGPGIRPELREDYLKPFRQAKTANVNGAGLGLAFVDRAARKHGGGLLLGPSNFGGLSATITLADIRSAQ